MPPFSTTSFDETYSSEWRQLAKEWQQDWSPHARVRLGTCAFSIPSVDSIVHEFTFYFFSPGNLGMAAAIPCHTQLTPLIVVAVNLHMWSRKLRQVEGSRGQTDALSLGCGQEVCVPFYGALSE